MREIEFRAKRIDNGEWIYGYYAFKYNETSHYILIEQLMVEDWLESYFIEREVNEETLGQFTGLTDMNGTKIFEGDIVKDNDITLVIKWDNNNSRYEAIRPFKSLPKNYELTLSFCEVIGNIYDNKELLDEEENK